MKGTSTATLPVTTFVRQGVVFVVNLEWCKPMDKRALMEGELWEIDKL